MSPQIQHFSLPVLFVCAMVLAFSSGCDQDGLEVLDPEKLPQASPTLAKSATPTRTPTPRPSPSPRPMTFVLPFQEHSTWTYRHINALKPERTPLHATFSIKRLQPKPPNDAWGLLIHWKDQEFALSLRQNCLLAGNSGEIPLLCGAETIEQTFPVNLLFSERYEKSWTKAERVTVPAGTFECLTVYHSRRNAAGDETEYSCESYCPGIGIVQSSMTFRQSGREQPSISRYELISYHLTQGQPFASGRPPSPQMHEGRQVQQRRLSVDIPMEDLERARDSGSE